MQLSCLRFKALLAIGCDAVRPQNGGSPEPLEGRFTRLSSAQHCKTSGSDLFAGKEMGRIRLRHQHPLTQNYYLRKRFQNNHFAKVTNFMHNSSLKSLSFLESLENLTKNNAQGIILGTISCQRARFQTPSSVSFLALADFWGENSVSSSEPIICVPKRTHRVFRRTHRVCRRARELCLPNQYFRNSIPPVSYSGKSYGSNS